MLIVSGCPASCPGADDGGLASHCTSADQLVLCEDAFWQTEVYHVVSDALISAVVEPRVDLPNEPEAASMGVVQSISRTTYVLDAIMLSLKM